MRTSFWFVPTTIVLGAVVLATVLITLEVILDLDALDRWPLLFGAGADGSRGLLTAVASSMITVAGVVFSITIVALAQTSSQYTPRLLRNFMSDRINQTVLGVFVGIFAYCLMVLRTIRGGDEGKFVPSVAVLVGLLLAFAGVGFLIYFIHHISMSIQASSILAAVAQETITTVDRLYPVDSEEAGEDHSAGSSLAFAMAEPVWSAVAARRTGYIEGVDRNAVAALAKKRGIVVRMERAIGEFVIEGAPLASVSGPDGFDEEAAAELNDFYEISRHRTLQQDAAFGIRQIVDVALRALSPGINDTTTAVMCLDYLEAILVRLTGRPMPPPHYIEEGEVRLIGRGPSFEALLDESLDQIRQNAGGNMAIQLRMLTALENLAEHTDRPARRAALREKARSIAELAERTIEAPNDRVIVATRAALVRAGIPR
jgi:uncharacterized membrane protein